MQCTLFRQARYKVRSRGSSCVQGSRGRPYEQKGSRLQKFQIQNEAATVKALHCSTRFLAKCRSFTTLQQSPTNDDSLVVNVSRSGENFFYEKSTHRMLKAPLGSFDSRGWHEADFAMRFWNRQRTVQSVHYAFALLERFVEEYCYQCKQNSEIMPLPVVLTTLYLNFTVNNWQWCAKSLPTPGSRSDLPNPTIVSDKIDYLRSYCKKKPTTYANSPLQPNIYTYTMVLDALAFGQPTKSVSDNQKNRVVDDSTIPIDCHGNLGWYFTKVPAPDLSEMLLHRLLEESKSDRSLRPTIVTFDSVIYCWSRSRSPDAPRKAEAILQMIKGLSNDPEWKNLQPTNVTYGTVIHTWGNSGLPIAAERAELLVNEMKESNNPDTLPNEETYYGVLKAWSHSDDPRAAQHANNILQERVSNYLEQLHQQDKNQQNRMENIVRPLLLKCFLQVLNIHAIKGDAHGASLLAEQLQSLYETSGRHADLCPNVDIFNCVLRAWSRSKSEEAPVRVERIIQSMIELAESTGNSGLYPNLWSYTIALHSLAGMHPEEALQRGERLFDKIKRTPGVVPNLVTYNVMLHLLARSKRKDAAVRAEDILRSMWDKFNSKESDFMPDVTSYNTCIDAWKDRNDPHRAEALFRELQEQYQRTQDMALKPTNYSYASIITAWARSSRRMGAEKAQSLFEKMLENEISPTTVQYNATIHAWAVRGDVDRAEALVGRSLEDYQKGNKRAKPNVQMFSTILNALAKSRSKDPWANAKRAESILIRMEELSTVLGPDMKPNSFSFNAVLDCFAKCRKTKEAPRHAEKILRHMQAMHKAGNLNVKPSVISYTSVMNCWVNSFDEETPHHVEELFRELSTLYASSKDNSLKPSQFTYNALIGAYARNTTIPDAVDKARGHFLAMMEKYNSTGDKDFCPGPHHFSAVMSVMAKRGMADEAESFLESILRICRADHESNNKKLEISSSFNNLIGAHARSRIPGSAEKAEAVLRRMQDLGSMAAFIEAPPNVVSYTAVMMAWKLASTPLEKEKAVAHCEGLLHDMLRQAQEGTVGLKPNAMTIGTMLEVLADSNLPDKNERAGRVLEIMKVCGVRPDPIVLKAAKACKTR